MELKVLLKIQLDRQEEPQYILRVFTPSGSFTIPQNTTILAAWMVK